MRSAWELLIYPRYVQLLLYLSPNEIFVKYNFFSQFSISNVKQLLLLKLSKFSV